MCIIIIIRNEGSQIVRLKIRAFCRTQLLSKMFNKFKDSSIFQNEGTFVQLDELDEFDKITHA